MKNKKQQYQIPTLVENKLRLETDDDKANAFGKKLELTFNDLPESVELLLVKFYNDSLASNVLPEQCKSSIITMIPKKGNKNNIKNYRPVSSTPCIIKLFEKIIQKNYQLMYMQTFKKIKPQVEIQLNKQFS